MVEGEVIERSPNLVPCGGLLGGPERAVEFVAGLVAAGQAEFEHLRIKHLEVDSLTIGGQEFPPPAEPPLTR